MKNWKPSWQPSRKRQLGFALAGLLCLVSTLLSLCLGAAPLSLSQLWQAMCRGPQDTAGYILWYTRLPRTAGCLLAGAALSVSGCILQRVLGNSLASPNIIGINAGAGLAVTLCCSLGVLSGWAVAGAAFAGALGAVMLVMVLARKTGASRTTVILAGVAINSILNAFRDALTTLVPDTAALSGEFRVGGFSAVVTSRLVPAAILIAVTFAAVMTLCNELDVLALGEDTAQSLGLSVKGIQRIFLLFAALLAGSAVSFAGLLGFVGLLVPHVARKVVGTQGRHLLPFCCLAGAGFVTGCDLLARLIAAPFELPVGILLSIIGGPFFLVLLLKRHGGGNHG